MATKQGSVELLNHPVARHLLQLRLLASLAFYWID
jgi:hypothetical protein